MPIRRGMLAITTILLSCPWVAAQTTSYTDPALFQASINSGSYLETFDSLNVGNVNSPLNFSGNGFAYRAEPEADIFFTIQNGTDIWLSTFNQDTGITFTFTSNNVTAVGANIFVTNVSGERIPGNITLHNSDGSTITLVNPLTTGFAGFTTSSPISFVRVDDVGGGAFVTVNNFIVGTAAVPEPTTWALIGLSSVAGIGGLWQWRRRHRQQLNENCAEPDVDAE